MKRCGILSRKAAFGAAIVALTFLRPATAQEIEGVQPAALDQPRINVLVRTEPNGKPLMAKANGEEGFNVEAFLDTGASGLLLSKQTADALHVQPEAAKGPDGKPLPIVFTDVGVGGGDKFHVSQPLYFSFAPFHPHAAVEDPASYKVSIGPARAQISTSVGLIEMLGGGLDVIGMPAMQGNVMVMDAKPVNTFSDTMRTYLYPANTKYNDAHSNDDPGIPITHRHVRLSFASFAGFTTTTPPSGVKPIIAANPFVGPNPFAKLHPEAKPDLIPPITLKHGTMTTQGSWLLDTGAAASMISQAQAAKLGITYVKGTYGTGSPKLTNVPDKEQFSITVGGIGGQKKSAGFFINEMIIQTTEGKPIVYKGAPMLVADITVEDPQTKQKFTLDGVLGMNFFVATANVKEGLLPDIGKMTAGPFRWIVFDQAKGLLGVE
jgi:hypothetical protein